MVFFVRSRCIWCLLIYFCMHLRVLAKSLSVLCWLVRCSLCLFFLAPLWLVVSFSPAFSVSSHPLFHTYLSVFLVGFHDRWQLPQGVRVTKKGANTTPWHLGRALGRKAGNEAVAQEAHTADVVAHRARKDREEVEVFRGFFPGVVRVLQAAQLHLQLQEAVLLPRATFCPDWPSEFWRLRTRP